MYTFSVCNNLIILAAHTLHLCHIHQKKLEITRKPAKFVPTINPNPYLYGKFHLPLQVSSL